MKMKIVISIFIIFISILLPQCAVNNATGLITVYNLTSWPIHNIKIGQTTLVYTLGAGEKYDYWIVAPLEGKVSGDEVDEVLGKYLINDKTNNISYTLYRDDPVCVFKTFYEYHLDIMKADSGIRLYVNEGIRPSDNTAYDYPVK